MMKKRFVSVMLCLSGLLSLVGCNKTTQLNKSLYSAVRDDYANTTNPVIIRDSILYVTFDVDDQSFEETMDVYPNDDLFYVYSDNREVLTINIKDKKARIIKTVLPTTIEEYQCDLIEKDCSQEAEDNLSILNKRLEAYGIIY